MRSPTRRGAGGSGGSRDPGRRPDRCVVQGEVLRDPPQTGHRVSHQCGPWLRRAHPSTPRRCVSGHRFLSEEVAVRGKFDFGGPVWVIDPIDGTSNYAHGHPYVSVSAALVIDGKPRLGVVHAPFLRETFTAVLGEGAQLNGKAIHVSSASELRSSLIGTGFPHDRSHLGTSMRRIERLLITCQDIRRAGSPALDISWVAAGRLDGHCESLAPWDIAAAGLIATEAGAVRGNLLPGKSGWPPLLRGEEFIVATPGIFDSLCELLKTSQENGRGCSDRRVSAVCIPIVEGRWLVLPRHRHRCAATATPHPSGAESLRPLQQPPTKSGVAADWAASDVSVLHAH